MVNHTPGQSTASKLLEWSSERFPVAMLVVGLPTFLSAHLAGSAWRADGSGQVSLGLEIVAGWIAAVCFLLSVRIFDEFKDYADDCKLHPERALSRGRVTLDQLGRLNIASIGVQLIYCLFIDRGVGVVTSTWAVAWLWLLAMRVEFFVSSWLRPKIVLYALSHAVVTPLATWWMFASGSRSLRGGAVLAWCLIAAYASSLLFEFARKTLAPEDEVVGAATYSSTLGTARASSTICATAVCYLVAVGFEVDALVHRMGAPSAWRVGFVVLSAVLSVAVVTTYLRFAKDPTSKTHAWCEPLSALTMLAPALFIIVLVLLESDVHWSLR